MAANDIMQSWQNQIEKTLAQNNSANTVDCAALNPGASNIVRKRIMPEVLQLLRLR